MRGAVIHAPGDVRFENLDVLVPHRVGVADWLQAAIRPQVRAAHPGGDRTDDRVGRRHDLPGVEGLEAHVAGGVDDCSAHGVLPSVQGSGGRSRGSETTAHDRDSHARTGTKSGEKYPGRETSWEETLPP